VISAPSVPCSAKTSRPSPPPKSGGSESTHRLIRKKLIGPDPRPNSDQVADLVDKNLVQHFDQERFLSDHAIPHDPKAL
jgi:hypothetical protein